MADASVWGRAQRSVHKLRHVHFPSQLPHVRVLAFEVAGVDFAVAAIGIVRGEIDNGRVCVRRVLQGAVESKLRSFKDLRCGPSIKVERYASALEKLTGVFSKVLFSGALNRRSPTGGCA